MKKLLLTLWFCALAIAAASAQEKCNVVYEGEKAMLCTSDYLDTYLIATALRFDFENVNQDSPIWIDAKEYFSSYKDHSFIKGIDKYVFKDYKMAHYMVNISLMRYGIFQDTKKIPVDQIKASGVFPSKKALDGFLSELAQFYKDTNAESFLQKYKNQQNLAMEEFNATRNLDSYINEMLNYTGVNTFKDFPNNAKFVIFSSFFKNNEQSFGTSSDNKAYYWHALVPAHNNNGEADIDYSIGFGLKDFLTNLLSYTVERNTVQINKNTKKQNMQDYVTWEKATWLDVAKYYLIFAIEARVYEKVSGDQKKYDVLQMASNNGLKQITRSYDALTEYELDRDSYPVINVFMENWIKATFSAK